jgi:hypothetical protein
LDRHLSRRPSHASACTAIESRIDFPRRRINVEQQLTGDGTAPVAVAAEDKSVAP